MAKWICNKFNLSLPGNKYIHSHSLIILYAHPNLKTILNHTSLHNQIIPHPIFNGLFITIQSLSASPPPRSPTRTHTGRKWTTSATSTVNGWGYPSPAPCHTRTRANFRKKRPRGSSTRSSTDWFVYNKPLTSLITTQHYRSLRGTRAAAFITYHSSVMYR